MSPLPIAAQLPSAMYGPLVVLLVGYAVLGILSNRARSHDDRAAAERYANFAFTLVLAAVVWTVVLLLSAVVSYPSRFYDMVIIIFVIITFFALVVVACFAITDLIPRMFRRGSDR